MRLFELIQTLPTPLLRLSGGQTSNSKEASLDTPSSHLAIYLGPDILELSSTVILSISSIVSSIFNQHETDSNHSKMPLDSSGNQHRQAR